VLLPQKKGFFVLTPNNKRSTGTEFCLETFPNQVIYFAGPDVFYPNYNETIALIKNQCENYGFWPLIPGEEIISDPKLIFQKNIQAIQRADGIVANLNPFRGQEPDSGTVFELGYGYSLGKWIIGYQDDPRPLIEKLKPLALGPNQGRLPDQTLVEDFGYPVNLMLGVALTAVVSSLAEALKMVETFGHPKKSRR
jgi:nucleoside 2-deoxyribosyltransferase